MIPKLADKYPQREPPARRAIEHLLDEHHRARAERDAAEVRLRRFAETIRLLNASLPEPERVEFERRLKDSEDGVQAPPRGGEAFSNVIALFSRHRRTEWTVPEVYAALEKEGSAVDSKAISNAIAYLARTGRLERISRGRYVVKGFGIGIETEDGNPGGSRLTEHDV